MEKKFEIGDRVMCTDNGALGVITSIDIDPMGVCDGYTVLFDDGEETWICADMVVHSDEPPYDPKTAFLSELKGLLEKYGADIWMDSYGFDANFLRIDLEGAEKQSFEVENGVINHDGEIKIKPLNPNWY